MKRIIAAASFAVLAAPVFAAEVGDPANSEFPVIAETVPGVSAISIVGIVAAGGTPPALVRRISAEIEKWSKVVKASGAKVD